MHQGVPFPMCQHVLQTICALQMYVSVLMHHMMYYNTHCINSYAVAGRYKCFYGLDRLPVSTTNKQLTQVCASWLQNCAKETLERRFSALLKALESVENHRTLASSS